MKKRELCIIAALLLAMVLCVSAAASDGAGGTGGGNVLPGVVPGKENQPSGTDTLVQNVPVSVDVPSSNFSVTVPTSVNLSINSMGVSTGGLMTVKNDSPGPVIIKSAVITPQNGWKLSENNDFSAVPVDTKSICFRMDGKALTMDGETASADPAAFSAIRGGGTENHTLNAWIPTQSQALRGEVPAMIQFTIGWYTE